MKTLKKPFGLTSKERQDLARCGLNVLDQGDFGYIGVNLDLVAETLRKQKWRDYAGQLSPVNAFCLSLMKYEDHEKVDVKLAVYRIIYRLRLSFELFMMIMLFTDVNLKLNDTEKELFIKKLDEEFGLREDVNVWDSDLFCDDFYHGFFDDDIDHLTEDSSYRNSASKRCDSCNRRC